MVSTTTARLPALTALAGRAGIRIGPQQTRIIPSGAASLTSLAVEGIPWNFTATAQPVPQLRKSPRTGERRRCPLPQGLSTARLVARRSAQDDPRFSGSRLTEPSLDWAGAAPGNGLAFSRAHREFPQF